MLCPTSYIAKKVLNSGALHQVDLPFLEEVPIVSGEVVGKKELHQQLQLNLGNVLSEPRYVLS